MAVFMIREANTSPSLSAGAVRGDRHRTLRKQVLYNSGFLLSLLTSEHEINEAVDWDMTRFSRVSTTFHDPAGIRIHPYSRSPDMSDFTFPRKGLMTVV